MSDGTRSTFDPIPLGTPQRAPDMSALGLLPPLPKPATPVEPRSTLPRTELPAVKSETVIAEPPKAPVPGRLAWVPEAARAMFKPTRSKGVMAAGLASLACGVLVANWMWPSAKPQSDSAQVDAPLTPPTVIETKTKLEPPALTLEPVKLPVPTVSVEPLKLPPPSVNVEPVKVPDVPPIVLPTAPKPDGNVKTAGNVEVPLITLPPLVPVKAEAAAVVPPVPKVDLPLPKPDVAAPVLPKLDNTPAVQPVLPKIDPAMTPPVTPKIEVPPTTPKIEMPTTPPAAEPKFVPVTPKIEAPLTPPPVIESPRPSTPAPLELARPAGSPREDYDVDVHYPSAGDTWAAISKSHLGDERYADAIRMYNGNRTLIANQGVDVPPIHVLRKQYANLIAAPRTVEPVSREVTRTAGGLRSYEIPAGGMTIKEIAKKALGDENFWGQIWELNPKLRADEPVPAGTRIKLPPDSGIGE